MPRDQEEPLALVVRVSDGVRGKTVPFRNPPALGKVVFDLFEPFADDPRDVFEEQPGWLALGEDSPDGWPQPALVTGSAALAGHGYGWTRNARHD